MNRRNSPIGGLENFGGASYNFTETPTTGSPATAEYG